jgi:predicted nuclease of predicted toxin-antitoxin system
MVVEAWRLFLDECVEGPVLDGLRRCGVDAESARSQNRLRRTDKAQLVLAAQDGRTLLTWDTDFIGESQEHLGRGGHHCGVLLGLARISVGDKIRGVLRFLEDNAPEDLRDQVRWIPRH